MGSQNRILQEDILTLLFIPKIRLEDLLAVQPPSPSSESPSESSTLLDAKTGLPIARVPGLALTYSETLVGAPPLLPALIRCWSCLHKQVVLITVRRVRANPLSF
jgi:hypothetical protein